jgi:hypothetical protein
VHWADSASDARLIDIPDVGIGATGGANDTKVSHSSGVQTYRSLDLGPHSVGRPGQSLVWRQRSRVAMASARSSPTLVNTIAVR